MVSGEGAGPSAAAGGRPGSGKLWLPLPGWRLRQGLVGREERRLRLDEPDDPPRALPRLGRAVEVGAGDREGALRVRPEEPALRGDARLDADEAEPEGAGGRAGLAAFVGDVHGKRIAVGQARTGPPSFRPARGVNAHLERAVLPERRPSAGDDLASAAAASPTTTSGDRPARA